MVQAIGSSPAYAALNRGAATAGLQAQLARYQQQLSDCVNCDTANTAEGKAQIQAVSLKISEVRARIDQVGEVKTDNRADAPVSSTAAATGNDGIDTGASSAARNGSLGGQIDVFA